MSALFWRLFLFNALVFLAGAGVLVLSPATVSTPVSVTEAAVLAVGAAVMLGVNAALLRSTLRPLNGLTALMERVDLLRPGHGRAEQGGEGEQRHRHSRERVAEDRETPVGPRPISPRSGREPQDQRERLRTPGDESHEKGGRAELLEQRSTDGRRTVGHHVDRQAHQPESDDHRPRLQAGSAGRSRCRHPRQAIETPRDAGYGT